MYTNNYHFSHVIFNLPKQNLFLIILPLKNEKKKKKTQDFSSSFTAIAQKIQTYKYTFYAQLGK